MDETEISKILQNHEKRISSLEKGSIQEQVQEVKNWYRPNSTIAKIVLLIEEGSLKEPKDINQIISRLKEKDFHLKASDLTLPLRRVVRKGLLLKTKKRSDGSVSPQWLYVKA